MGWRGCFGLGALAALLVPLARGETLDPVKAEEAFQRHCADLARAAELPEVKGDAWFNGQLMDFQRWRPYSLPIESWKGRIVLLAFIGGSHLDGAVQSLGQWWARTKREELMPVIVLPGADIAGGLDFAQKATIRFPLAADTTWRTAHAFGLSEQWPELPVIFVIQRDGTLGAVIYGEFYESRLDLAIARVWIGRDKSLSRDLRVPDDFLRTSSPWRNGILAGLRTLKVQGTALKEVLKSLCRQAQINLLLDIGDGNPPVFFNCKETPLREVFYLLSREYALTFDWVPSARVPSALIIGRVKKTDAPVNPTPAGTPAGKSG